MEKSLNVQIDDKSKTQVPWRRSAPAHDNILLMRSTWKGWTRIRMWNWSLAVFFTMYCKKDQEIPITAISSIKLYLTLKGHSVKN